MTTQKIGTAILDYNQKGIVEHAVFIPADIEIDYNSTLLNELKSITKSKEITIIQQQADLIMASFFERNNKIELADREKYELRRGEVKNITHWEDGTIKKVELSYYFGPKDDNSSIRMKSSIRPFDNDIG